STNGITIQFPSEAQKKASNQFSPAAKPAGTAI
ncbi:MAG: hypothetical protein PWQ83_782, partial [Thermosipho sp. (in: thermotogales)]|nr:hypothetical protein [Thermosipho sp. (in: thermotogales)]